MAAFCIPKHIAAGFKEAARTGEITVEKLYKMTSDQRRELFAKYSDSAMAKEVNTGFEKAMASNQKKTFENWAKATFVGKDKQVRLNTVTDKINELDKAGLLTPQNEGAFLQDLVAEKLGITVTPAEAQRISGHANNLEKLSQTKSEFGTPTIEYFKEKQKLNNYLDSLHPASRLKVATSTIARGNMLFNFHSPLLNIESNSIQAFMEAITRRITSRRIFGENNTFASRYMKFAMDVYNKTGFDISRFEAQGGERRVLGEDMVHTQGKGLVRKVGQVYEDLVFRKTQGLPDVAYSAFHFSDSANLQSSIMAKAEGLKGNKAKTRAFEIFKDATSLDPQTAEGARVRAQAMADALAGTYTNDTLYSNVGLGIRKVFNLASGDLRAGDVLEPFVKTPANVLGASLDASGVTVPVRILYGMQKTLMAMKRGESFTDATKSSFAGTARAVTRAGLGMTFAYLISNAFKPDEFIGQFPTSQKEQQLLELRRATPNSIKVGDKWVSLDFLGPLGASVLGFLYAKKYGKTPENSAFQYAMGVGQTLQNLPGLKEIAGIYDTVKNLKPTDQKGIADAVPGIAKAAVGFLEGRIVPSFVHDIAKMTDPFDRQADSKSITDAAQKNIPGLRQDLPVNKDLFSDPVKTENWLSTLLFGSRVKTVQDSPVIKELVSLDQQGALPSITDVARSSTRAKNLKAQIGESKFNDAMLYFGNNLKTNMQDAIDSTDYQDAETPQDKQKILNQVKEDTFTEMLDTYDYVKPEKP